MIPLLNQIAQVRGMMSPQNMVNRALMNNPQMKQAMDYVNANGGDAKAAFYKLAGEMGVDPEEILKVLRNA